MDFSQLPDSTRHARLLRLATRAALAVALTLVVAKALAWWQSGSVSLLAGLTDSLLDSAASLLNLIAVHIALRPTDDNHRFGHGKAEALAGLGQALFIGASAVLIAVQAFKHLHTPPPLGDEWLGMMVMVASLILTGALLILQRYVIARTGSHAIAADALHYRSDMLLNASILIALLLSHWGWKHLDALFALGIAFYILFSALQIIRGSVRVLMDEELPDQLSQQIETLAAAVEGVRGVHDVRSRDAGAQWFVQLHIELDGHISLDQAHAHCLAVERTICTSYPKAQVLVHADPYSSHPPALSSKQ